MSQSELIEQAGMERRRIHLAGVVQGVGFRPYAANLARSMGLTGWVRNSPTGLDLEVQGTPDALDAFTRTVVADPPPLARILEVHTEAIPVEADETDLEIRSSSDDGKAAVTDMSPDAATCPACLDEIRDPSARRHGYAFTNCTHCGPRYTIIRSLPYDRPRTTMSAFEMCDDCRYEYEDPEDRRYHAQPIACPVCGPKVWFVRTDDLLTRDEHRNAADPEGVDAVHAAAEMMRQGGVVALRGIGGFHLACRAAGTRGLNRLRSSKFRPSKPFAVMVGSVEEAALYCEVDDAEARLLEAPEAPIVLLNRRLDAERRRLPVEVAPQNPSLGLMLPFSPLHHLLMEQAGEPLVMTSGNLSGEPLCVTIEEAVEKLSPFVDGFLLHDRPIRRRCDDSVAMVVQTSSGPVEQPVRRSRGLAPLPVLLPDALILDAPLLAVGGELKNAAGLVVGRRVILTQHNGDLESLDARRAHAGALEDLESLLDARPQVIACDLHPGYGATKYARQRGKREGLPVIEVQHHHAHVAACLAEHGRTDTAIGLAFDGTGYGIDGRIWGGEVLIADLERFDRRFHLEYLPLPGGDAAIRHPWRTAMAYLMRALPEEDPEVWLPGLPVQETELIARMVEQGVNAMPTSSMGRLFDAVSALVGACRESTHEGHAAIALEALARECDDDPGPYPVRFTRTEIRVKEILAGVLNDLENGRSPAAIALAFHRTVAALSAAAAEEVREQEWSEDRSIDTVALSGGVWQNRLLLEEALPLLEAAGFEVLIHQAVPANDGGLAYGQAAVASAILAAERE